MNLESPNTCCSGGEYIHYSNNRYGYTPVCGLPAAWKHYPVNAVAGHFNYHCEQHGNYMKTYSDTQNYTGKFERV